MDIGCQKVQCWLEFHLECTRDIVQCPAQSRAVLVLRVSGASSLCCRNLSWQSAGVSSEIQRRQCVFKHSLGDCLFP